MSVCHFERPEDAELHTAFLPPRTPRFQTPGGGLYRFSTAARTVLDRSERTIGLVSASQQTLREGWSYCGEVWTDAHGRAVVALPPFARIHRGGFHCELSPVDTQCTPRVVEGIDSDRFAVETGEPDVKVASRVTPLRAPGDPNRHAQEESPR